MKRWTLLFILISQPAWARLCTLEEIQTLDTIRVGETYSSYHLMSQVNLAAPLIAYLPRLDSTSSESNAFQTVTFIGLGGWIYYAYKTVSPALSCEDGRGVQGSYYRPKFEEVLNYHHREKEFFWKSYTWTAGWMLGLMLTSQYNDRKSGAAAALILPWLFSYSHYWPAFAEDQELQFSLVPKIKNNQWIFEPTLTLNF